MHVKQTSSLESVEDAPSCSPDAWSLEDDDNSFTGPLWPGRGTVGRVHSNTVNGSANDLSYMRYKDNKYQE